MDGGIEGCEVFCGSVLEEKKKLVVPGYDGKHVLKGDGTSFKSGPLFRCDGDGDIFFLFVNKPARLVFQAHDDLDRGIKFSLMGGHVEFVRLDGPVNKQLSIGIEDHRL